MIHHYRKEFQVSVEKLRIHCHDNAIMISGRIHNLGPGALFAGGLTLGCGVTHEWKFTFWKNKPQPLTPARLPHRLSRNQGLVDLLEVV